MVLFNYFCVRLKLGLLMNIHSNKKPFLRSMLLASVVLVSGCASVLSERETSPADLVINDNSNNFTEVWAFLDKQSISSSASFLKSPWGASAELNIVDRYFAGSGRECVVLSVSVGANPSQIERACRQGRSWQTVRPVTTLSAVQ